MLRPVSVSGGEPFEELPPCYAHFQAQAPRAGAAFDDRALSYLEDAGAIIEHAHTVVADQSVDAIVRSPVNAARFLVLAHGTPDDRPRGGLRRSDTVKKMGAVALFLQEVDLPLLVITSHLPAPKSVPARNLARLGGLLFDVVATTADLAPGLLGYPGFLGVLGDTAEMQCQGSAGSARWRS